MAVHVWSRHPHVSIADNEALWKITNAEQQDMKKEWSERFNVKATRRGKKKAVAPLVISAAHSSRLILQNDEDSEDDNDSVPDETPNEEADDDETPEENVDDDGAPGDGSDEMFEEVDDIRDEDGSLEDHSQDNERLLSSSGTEIASDRTEHELVSQMKKNNS